MIVAMDDALDALQPSCMSWAYQRPALSPLPAGPGPDATEMQVFAKVSPPDPSFWSLGGKRVVNMSQKLASTATFRAACKWSREGTDGLKRLMGLTSIDEGSRNRPIAQSG